MRSSPFQWLPADVMACVVSLCPLVCIPDVSLTNKQLHQFSKPRFEKTKCLIYFPFVFFGRRRTRMMTQINLLRTYHCSAQRRTILFRMPPILDLEHRLHSPQHMMSLCTAVEVGSLEKVIALNIGRNGLNSSSFVEFCASLDSPLGLRRVEKLCLSSNGLIASDMSTLASSILNNSLPSLRYLDLDFNAIGDDGFIVLASVFTKVAPTKLVLLNVAWNHIGDRGMTAFAELVHSGTFRYLAYLNFGGNDVGDDGMVAFVSACVANSPTCNLKTLSIHCNAIGEDGTNAVTGALHNGAFPALSKLSAQANQKENHDLVQQCVKREIVLV